MEKKKKQQRFTTFDLCCTLIPFIRKLAFTHLTYHFGSSKVPVDDFDLMPYYEVKVSLTRQSYPYL